MTNETAPALTDAGWREVLEIGATCMYPGADMVVGDTPHSDLRIHAGPTVIVEARDRERHALAALALHGQPFGFTREELDYLRVVCEWGVESLQAQHRIAVDGDSRVVGARRALAKIAALLPPK